MVNNYRTTRYRVSVGYNDPDVNQSRPMPRRLFDLIFFFVPKYSPLVIAYAGAARRLFNNTRMHRTVFKRLPLPE